MSSGKQPLEEDDKSTFIKRSSSVSSADERWPPEIVINPPSSSDRNSKSRTNSGSSTKSKMGSDKHRDSKSSKSSSKSTSKSSSKAGSSRAEKDDWSEVYEPDERRRIQNRLAQRKFREKAKDQKESKDRDMENQLRAGYSYSTPEPESLGGDYNLSGLPWGGPSMKHIVAQGKAKQQGSQAGSQDYQYGSYGNYEYGGGSGGGSEYKYER